MPRTAKKSPAKKSKTRSARKLKKAVRSDILPALLLTTALVAASVIISIVVISIGREKIQPAVSHAPTALPELVFPETTFQETALLEASPQEAAPHENLPVRDKPVTEKLVTSTVAPPEQPPRQLGTLVFVIDDAGNNLQELEPFLRFPGPLTIAVLPGLTHSAEAARRIRAAGKEVFLHQPMEALGGQDPGPGAIFTGMNTAEVLAILSQNIAEIGPVAGMNNHQGSKITMDKQIMETVLAFCQEQGISFLDSRTTAETVVPAAARDLGIKIGERNVFIDNEQDRPSMDRSIKGGLALAAQKGSSVMIGHTWSPELAPLLTEMHQDFIEQGYILATAANFINR